MNQTSVSGRGLSYLLLCLLPKNELKVQCVNWDFHFSSIYLQN